MIPKHKNPASWESRDRDNRMKKRDAALAPYNFVPLPDQIVKVDQSRLADHDTYAAGRHSGWLECTLTTASPIYIRGMVKPDQYENKESKDLPEFYYIDDANQPVIPGSSLRGLLRNMIEIAGYGKITEVSNKKLVYRAVAEGEGDRHSIAYSERFTQDLGGGEIIPLMRAGYMEKRGSGDWGIRPAMERDGTTFALINSEEFLLDGSKPWRGCKNAYQVFVKVGPYKNESLRENDSLSIKQARVSAISDNDEGGKYIAAVRIISGKMDKKKNDVVAYLPNLNTDLLPLGDDLIDAYNDQLRNNAQQKNLLGADGVLHDGQPVFYLIKEDGTVDFFGHTRFFRVQYPYSPYDLIPDELKRENDLDLAEALFGFVKGKDARAGRVSVTDAHLLPNQNHTSGETIIPRILSTPKSTTFQHYLVQDKPDWFIKGRKLTTRLHDYSEGHAVLRGNKLYWHKGPVSLQDIREPNPKQPGTADKQHTNIRPLRSGVEFNFKIHFENLAGHELGALLWVLQVASDERYRLKLGMGKPLGMGAVKIQGDLNLIDREKRYRELFDQENWAECSTSSDRANHVAEFEQYVLQKIGNGNAKSLADLERIQMLLKMLSWEDRPANEDTRYMEIRHPQTRANEYKGRPVLPDPLGVGKKAIQKQPEILEESQPEARKAVKKRDPVVTIAPDSELIKESTTSVMDFLAQNAAKQAEKEEQKKLARQEKKNKKK